VRVVRKAFISTLRDQAALPKRVDVGIKGQRDNIGLQSVNDRPCLARRAAVRLLNAPLPARFALVFVSESLIQVFEQFARRVV